MKVVLVGAGMIPIPPPGYGAVEKHIWNLAQALEARGHDVSIVNDVFGADSKDEYRFAFWARKQVKQIPHDVLHLHTPGVATIFQAMGPRDWIYTTHSRHWAGAEGIGPKIGFMLERRAVAAATECIAVSRFVAQQIERPRPAHVVPNGVDVDRYAPALSARTGRVVVGVGEIAEHKQWHVAADAVGALRAAGMDVELRIAGPIRDVMYAKRLEAAGARLLGALDESELVKHLAEGDILAHPSVSESFGMAVVEGMACGLPVVCSDLLSFLVTHGKEGLLIPTEGNEQRVTKMREHLHLLLQDERLRRSLGAAARASAVEAYSWPSVAERVEKVYERAVAAGAGRKAA